MYDLVSKRNWFYLASLALIIPGLIFIFLGGIKPGIDFTGGTLWSVKVQPNTKTTDIANALVEQGHNEAVVQNSTQTDSTTGQQLILMQMRFKSIDQAEKFKIAQALLNTGKINGHLQTTLGNGASPSATGTPTTTTGLSSAPTPTTTVTSAITGTATLAPSKTVTSTTSPTATTTLRTGTSVTSTATTTATGTITSTGTPTSTIATGSTNSCPANADPATCNDAEESYQTVSGSVPSEITANAFLAVLVASLGILAYLWYAFRKVPSYGQGGVPQALRFGVCAVVAMLHDVLVVLGVFAILGYFFGVEIDSLFITAMLTVVGFSVHDTIVVFDRVRENLGRRIFPSYSQVVNHSLLQTVARSINTSLTVAFVLTALVLFGGGSIRDFVLALLIGIISGTYSSIFNASMLLVSWEDGWRPRPTQPPTAPTLASGKARTA